MFVSTENETLHWNNVHLGNYVVVRLPANWLLLYCFMENKMLVYGKEKFDLNIA